MHLLHSRSHALSPFCPISIDFAQHLSPTGMFLPDAFYDAADEFGILIYHDMQYAQEGHSPAVGAPQDPELRYQIRRLSSHPSIAIWDGCNECQVLLNTSTGICKPCLKKLTSLSHF